MIHSSHRNSSSSPRLRLLLKIYLNNSSNDRANLIFIQTKVIQVNLNIGLPLLDIAEFTVCLVELGTAVKCKALIQLVFDEKTYFRITTLFTFFILLGIHIQPFYSINLSYA